MPDEEARYVLPFVPAGKCSTVRLGGGDGDVRWTTLVECDVPARGERVVDVP